MIERVTKWKDSKGVLRDSEADALKAEDNYRNEAVRIRSREWLECGFLHKLFSQTLDNRTISVIARAILVCPDEWRIVLNDLLPSNVVKSFEEYDAAHSEVSK